MDNRYWNKDRFRPMSDLFPELASPNGVTGHEIGGDARMAVVPREPSRAYAAGTATFNAIGVFNDYVGLQSDQRTLIDWAFRQMSTNRIVAQAEANMPEGQPFVVYIHDPGTDHEDVVIMPGPYDPNQPSFGQGESFGTPTDNRVIAGMGRGKNVQPGSNYFYRGPDGKVHIASVAGAPGGLPAQQASPFIHREPNGEVRPRDVIKEGGPLPARGDLDPDHPNYRDPTGLA